jgi:hypothetical protein
VYDFEYYLDPEVREQIDLIYESIDFDAFEGLEFNEVYN